MVNFYLIVWKQFEKRKLLDFSEIVRTDDVVDSLEQMKKLNANKRLTTTEYKTYNLDELCANNGLSIVELVGNDEKNPDS